MDVVLSFEHFQQITNFPNILCNKLSSVATADVSQTKTLISNMGRGYTTYANLVQDFKTYVAMPVESFVAATNSTSRNWLFAFDTSNKEVNDVVTKYISNGPFAHLVANQFSNQYMATNDVTKFQSNFELDMQAVFSAVFSVLYGQVAFNPQITGSIPNQNVTSMQPNQITASLSTLVTNFKGKIYSYLLDLTDNTKYNTIQKYLQNLYTDMLAYAATSTVTGFNTFMYNLFFLAFQPFFCFLYISYQIPNTNNVVASNQAIRSNVLRGAAVLGCYKFVNYTLYGTYRLAAAFDPSSGDALLLRQAIDVNIMAPFNAEMLAVNAELAGVNSMLQTTLQEMGSFDDTNRQITMARGNALNIANNETQVLAKKKSAVTIKWVWFSILMTYLVAFAVVFILFRTNETAVQVFLGVSGTLLIVLCILGLISMA
jgi:hypothetical protein